MQSQGLRTVQADITIKGDQKDNARPDNETVVRKNTSIVFKSKNHRK